MLPPELSFNKPLMPYRPRSACTLVHNASSELTRVIVSTNSCHRHFKATIDVEKKLQRLYSGIYRLIGSRIHPLLQQKPILAPKHSHSSVAVTLQLILCQAPILASQILHSINRRFQVRKLWSVFSQAPGKHPAQVKRCQKR